MTPTPTPRGELVTASLDYDGGRVIAAHVPPEPPQAIVYAADGGWHAAALAEATQTASGVPVLTVGVESAPDDDQRLGEYSPSFDPDRFRAHENFFVEDVGGWVRTRLGVELPAERTAVWGASLGGELAIALTLRHPATYGVALSASPGAGYRPPDPLPAELPRAYLVAGDDEPFFLDNARRWADALAAAGADVVLEERSGAHGGSFWTTEFALMVDWAFGRRGQSMPR